MLPSIYFKGKKKKKFKPRKKSGPEMGHPVALGVARLTQAVDLQLHPVSSPPGTYQANKRVEVEETAAPFWARGSDCPFLCRDGTCLPRPCGETPIVCAICCSTRLHKEGEGARAER